MLIILILIIIGYMTYKKGYVNDEGAKTLSFLVVNITSPLYVISTAFSNDISISHDEFIFALLLVFAIYAILIIFSYLLPILLRVQKQERKIYTMLSIYTNTSFIGIPVATAILGTASLVYVAMFNIAFSLLFYTHGHICLLKGVEGAGGISLKRFINIGTICTVITLLIVWFNLDLPEIVEDTLTYAGRATTFMAMIVLGVSFAKMPLKKLFGNKKIYMLIIARFLLLSLVYALVLKQLFGDSLMARTMSLLLSLPSGNSPLLLGTRHNMDMETMTTGILLTTFFSVITVPITALVFS